MKIDAIEAIPIKVPRTPRLRIASAYGVIPSARFVVVIVRTSDGVEGIGEILGLARAGRIPCLLGSTLELGVHSAFMTHIGLPAPSIDSTVPSDIICPPAAPGVGVTLDDDALAPYRVDAA